MGLFKARPILLVLWLAAGCATAPPEMDYLSMPPLGPGWREARRQEQREVQRMREFVRGAETVDNWTELVVLQSFKKGPASAAPETALNSQRDFIRSMCPDLTWNIVKQEATTILYEWRVANCKPQPVEMQKFAVDQHAISLHIEGKWTVWRINYTMKVREMPAEKRAEWLQKLSEVRVETRSR